MRKKELALIVIERLKKEIEEFFESIYTKLKKNHKEDDIKNLREKMDEG